MSHEYNRGGTSDGCGEYPGKFSPCSSEHPSILAKPHTEDTFQTAQLTIRGIRAFSPDNEEKITFYKPLTLIVGHNGAGKTVRSSC